MFSVLSNIGAIVVDGKVDGGSGGSSGSAGVGGAAGGGAAAGNSGAGALGPYHAAAPPHSAVVALQQVAMHQVTRSRLYTRVHDTCGL